MSGIRIPREVSIYLEFHCQCRTCGTSIYHEATEYQQGSPLVLKVGRCPYGCPGTVSGGLVAGSNQRGGK